MLLDTLRAVANFNGILQETSLPDTCDTLFQAHFPMTEHPVVGVRKLARAAHSRHPISLLDRAAFAPSRDGLDSGL